MSFSRLLNELCWINGPAWFLSSTLQSSENLEESAVPECETELKRKDLLDTYITLHNSVHESVIDIE